MKFLFSGAGKEKGKLSRIDKTQDIRHYKLFPDYHPLFHFPPNEIKVVEMRRSTNFLMWLPSLSAKILNTTPFHMNTKEFSRMYTISFDSYLIKA